MYTTVCFRFGRVNFILALRLGLLKEVERLQVQHQQQCVYNHYYKYTLWHYFSVLLWCVCHEQESLGVTGDVAYTCETAGHFYLYQVLSRWEQYANKIKSLAKKVSHYTDTKGPV